MSEAPQTRKNALLWGNITSNQETKDEQAWELCQQYIAKRVAGVFFAPLERTVASEQTNHDRTAGEVMQSLIRLKYKIPDDIRIVGIDDVEYANLLPSPLTTVHQPCREIGVAAVAVMVERLSTPEMPVRDILLDCKLVVRESCGAQKTGDLPQKHGDAKF